MRRLRVAPCMKALATTSSSLQRTQRRCTAASNGGSSSIKPIAPPSTTTTTTTAPPQPVQTFPNGVASDIPRTPCAPSTATPIAPHKLHHSEMQVSVDASASSSSSSSSADHGQSTAASSSLPPLGSPSKDEWLAKISRIVQLHSTHDMEWIDFSAHNLPKHSLLADGAFVSATRKMLVEHGVPLELVRKVTETVWLPLTHESSDGRAACFVMRASQLATEARIEQARAVRIAEALTRHTVVLQSGGKTNQRPQAQQSSSSSHFPSMSNVENAAGGTILELSQRLNIFFVAANEAEQQRAKLITVHRMPMQLIDDLQNQWTERHRFDRPEVLLYRIIRGCISSFKRTEEHHARHLEELSRMLFRGHRGVQPAEWSDSEGEAVVRSNREFERAKTVTQRHGETRRQYFAASRSVGPGQDASSSSFSSFAVIRRLAYSGVRRMRHLVIGGEPTANATLGERDMALVMRQLQGVNRQASANLRILREVQRAYNKMTSVMVREKVSPHHLPTHGHRAGATTATRRSKRTRERAKKRVRHLKRRLKKNDLQLIRRSNRTPTTNRFGTFGAVSIQRHHHHHHHHTSSFLSKKYPHFHDHELALHLRTTIFQCEGLRDQSQSLLSLQVTIAASRLEELAGMLTVFSSFFIPLEFISGFFGTNFGAVLWFGTMPFGLPAVLLLMAGSAIATVRWVQKTTRVFGVRRP